ncbi:GNAT family N-acetyltransferase [Fodinicola acaciae]|uniref:GNAT family N-acetyltransferase n=1 Tax=Fodinicola acaciae TaxID=2681555 RepID=UPI0013D79288|nr:GNAT family protein [Fodinicola acaciae]
MDFRTDRLVLHAIDVPEAQRIHDQAPQPGDAWAADFPFTGDLIAITNFLRDTTFGHYLIRRRVDGLAIGGAGFKGCPAGGAVEIGYGLVPSARGHGYAAEAVTMLVRIAADRGVTTVVAETEPDNIASQRTLERAGFRQVDAAESCRYEFRI